MPLRPDLLIEARDLSAWRAWLSAHHETVTEIWLIFFKKHTGRAGVSHPDALDEALCFGWIDSLVRRIDDDRYAIKFTPRKATSVWSAINRKRYRELDAAGRLMPAGVVRAPTNRTYGPKPARSRVTPAYIRTAFAKHPAARRGYESLPASEQRRYVGWIDFAKKPETKARRLAEALKLLAAHKRLGLK